MTIVVSNTKRNFQMIDMLTDLKQAISRQRDKQNPHYGKFIYIYNQSVFCKTESDLLDEFSCMYERIKDKIKLYELGKRKKLERSFPFTKEFKLYTIKHKDTFVINEQAFQADKYFILEIRNQYTKGFDIPGFFETSSSIEPIELPKEVTYKKLVEFFNTNNLNGTIDWGFYSVYKEWTEIIEASYKLYKKVWKDQTYAQLMIRQYGDGYAITKTYFRKIFKLNKRYSRDEVKQLLQKGYDELGIIRIAKCSDLKEIFKGVDDFPSNGKRYMIVFEK